MSPRLSAKERAEWTANIAAYVCRLFGHRWVEHRFFAARWNQCHRCWITDEEPPTAASPSPVPHSPEERSE